MTFIEAIRKYGDVYYVGGGVRDKILGQEPKDLDILVTGIPMDALEKILSLYGRVLKQLIGGKLATLKFKPYGEKEMIDIAIPRTEVPTGLGHKGFNITVDHTLPIEKDLLRRDFTINAIAIGADGKYIDPFNGMIDLKNKIIRVVNPKAFSDDPLRMLRGVQFASRLAGFTIEPDTLALIQQNAHRINEISKERIFEELEKIVQKGNARVGAEWLIETGLFRFIFGGDDYDGDINIIPDKVKSIGEFIFLLLFNQPKPHLIFANRMKRVASVEKEIEALNLLKHSNGEFEDRVRITLAYGLFPDVINSTLIDPKIMAQIPDFISGKYPLSNKHLAVNGEDLMRIGITGTGIGSTIRKITTFIFQDALQNDKEAILNYLLQN